MGINRRFKLDEGATHQHFYLLSAALNGPDASNRSIEQLARVINADHALFGPIKLDQATFASFKLNFDANVYGQDIQIDRNHNPGDGVMAKILRVWSDGDKFLCELEWRPAGVKCFNEDGFRYFSIDFTDDYVDPETKKHHGPLLFGAALCPRPFIKNMRPAAGPGRTLLSEGGRTTFVPNYLQLNEDVPMETWLKKLKAALEAKKLSQAVITEALKRAKDQAMALHLGDDAAKLELLEPMLMYMATQLGEVEAANAQTAVASITLADVQREVQAAVAAIDATARQLTERVTTNRTAFTAAINAATGLSEETRVTLREQADEITGTLSADQVKQLAERAIKLGNLLEAANQRARIGLQLPGPIGNVQVTLATGGAGSQIHGLMRERLLLTDAATNGNLRLPEEKNLSPIARKVLAAFDQIHGYALENEHKMLASNGSTNIADGKFPVAAQRQVIVELLADLKILQLVNTIVDPGAQGTMQIPYEVRNVSQIVNGGIVYEGQPIPYAGVTQAMDQSWIVPRKIAMMMSNEMIHFSRVSLINWDAWSRNIASNARLMRDLVVTSIAAQLQRAADAFGAVAVVTETLTAQVNGTRNMFKTVNFPVVRQYTPRDVQGVAQGSTQNPITMTLNSVAITEYNGTGQQAAGNYFYFVNYNLGFFQIVNQLGVVQTPANTTPLVVNGYSYATNVVKFDLDVPADTDRDFYLNNLLNKIGDRKALMSQQRFVMPQYMLASNTLLETATQARAFEAASQKSGSALDSRGDMAKIKDMDPYGTNQPGIDIGDERILMGEYGTCTYGISKPFVTGEPFETIDLTTGRPTGQKQAYGEEYSTIHVPLPLRNRMTSVIAYSVTARAAV